MPFILEKVAFTYQKGMVFAREAVKDLEKGHSYITAQKLLY